ncbi:TNF receptor-associated factor homolog 1a-like isoform X2 [Helianthus annuus]|uniref:TNF receptor-associated factor homolog 1a-like isoform X2 n=1 Tax=Helianthus annuus TaxID=4232 RepID=UPI000B9057F3|nr:TNF receptor-associated factor homolog 1a-like isoform X2 [Helianthus annuus]
MIMASQVQVSMTTRINAFHPWHIPGTIYPQRAWCMLLNDKVSFRMQWPQFAELQINGWSHFAQFTIDVVNKDPKKSKYSDTLHRFWKKQHDWGWKRFMELSKVLDGLLDADTLIIKAQVQVIRSKV